MHKRPLKISGILKEFCPFVGDVVDERGVTLGSGAAGSSVVGEQLVKPSTSSTRTRVNVKEVNNLVFIFSSPYISEAFLHAYPGSHDAV